MLSAWKIYVCEPELYDKAGIEIPPKCTKPVKVVVIGEGSYGPKQNYDGYKAEKLRSERISDSKGCVTPDCIMRLVYHKLSCNSISTSIPPAEFDATAAERVRSGCDVIVVSRDADIPLYPWGHSTLGGRIFFPDKGASKLLCIDREHKLMILQTHFQQSATILMENSDRIRVFEVCLLVCALHLPHDYHYIPYDKAKYKFSNATGIGWSKISQIMRKLATSICPQKLEELTRLDSQDVIASLRDTVDSVKSGFPARACTAAIQFLSQPVLNIAHDAYPLSEYVYVKSCKEKCNHNYTMYSIPVGN